MKWSKRIEAHAQKMLERARLKAAGLPLRPASPKTAAALSEFRRTRIERAKACGILYPDACPHCRNKQIIRAGTATNGGAQRYRCRKCKRTFNYLPPTFYWPIMCHRCGSCNVERGGVVKSGRRGVCRDCKRYFTQGGKLELDRNQLILKMRSELLELPQDVTREAYQQAVLDVLQGKGYCWNVEFDINAAWRSARGHQYQQRGSDHFIFNER